MQGVIEIVDKSLAWTLRKQDCVHKAVQIDFVLIENFV